MTPAERAKAFVDEILIPREIDAELGRITPEDVALIRREALARGVSGGLHAREHGGQGWSHVEWFEVEEQFGRSTNALSWHVPTAYNVLAHGSPEQIERWLQAGAARRAARRLRGHRGARGLGPVGHHHDRDAGRRRLAPRRREVVRDLRRRRGGLHRHGAGASADAVPRRGRPAGHLGRRRPAVHPHLSARPPDDPLRGRGRRRGRGDRRRRRGRRAPARVVRRGAARDRRARLRRDAAAARGDHRVGDRARAGRRAHHRPPGRLLPARRLRRGRRRRPPARAGGRAARRRRRRPQARSTPRPRWRSCSSARPPTAAPTAACRSSAAAATRAPTSPSASGANCAWTASGRARARSSA